MKTRYNEDIGFDPEWLLGQIFNVVCVGTHYGSHKPLMGLAEVRRNTNELSNEEHPYIVWWMCDQSDDFDPFPLVYVSCGLGGSALVLGIRYYYPYEWWDKEPSDFFTWHLYTDTPHPRPDRMDEVITVQELRRRAIAGIQHRFSVKTMTI